MVIYSIRAEHVLLYIQFGWRFCSYYQSHSFHSFHAQTTKYINTGEVQQV